MSTRGPYAKGVERRKAILDEALTLFSRLGFKGASLRAIARELNMSPGIVHHYFPTREELLSEVVREWDKRNDEANTHEGGDQLQGFVRSMRHNVQIPGLIHLYSSLVVESSDPDHPSRSFLNARYERLTEEIASGIDARADAGLAPKDLDSVRTAQLLIAACEGLQLRWLHDPSFSIVEEFLHLLSDLGIDPRRPPH